MEKLYDRRRVLKSFGAACAATLLPRQRLRESAPLRITNRDCEFRMASVSEHTMRLTILPIQDGSAREVRSNGSLVPSAQGKLVVRLRSTTFEEARNGMLKAGGLGLMISNNPLTFFVKSSEGKIVQQIKIDEQSGVVSFVTGDSPLLGLGQGGPQFDRRGHADAMHSGQDGYRLATHGGRVPVPWLIGTSGWAMFFHQPFGTFDFTGSESRFQPASPQSTLPLDLFVVAASEPATIMAEYARLTGHAEVPPLWSFGYQQSHRTLGKPEEIMAEAKTFREKKLPCDVMIYLGTGFCPNGWNTQNGSFAWNSRAFPNPKETIEELHKDHFRVVPHVVILTDKLRGSAHDSCGLRHFNEESAACYWDMHREDFAMGVDGWWADEGDPLDAASRLVRHRMYWEGPQIDRPNERPYALHRNGCAGMQRYASFLWSGDVYSTWETLKTHVPIAINTSLSGIPYWGTDIGGFVPTKEFTAELYLRWFQFGALCTLFRCHGRTWKLRLPWGWDTGDPGPIEIRNYDGAAIPDTSQLHNAQVEPICRKYLELRYRMLPYLYSAVRECALTGMPILRALWLHYPEDPTAVACADQYLWGRDVLVAPVVEQAASSRRVYLPRGKWYDFWTNERIEGGREITRVVDLATMPLYVRAGAILPLGPVGLYVTKRVDQPLSLTIYPGTDGSFQLYEDDGTSFDYRRGEWMGIDMGWNEARRTLSLQLTKGSRMLPPLKRPITLQLGDQSREVTFEGRQLEVAFPHGRGG